MDHQQAVTAMSKCVAQAKDLILEYMDYNHVILEAHHPKAEELHDAIKLLNMALDNVVV